MVSVHVLDPGSSNLGLSPGQHTVLCSWALHSHGTRISSGLIWGTWLECRLTYVLCQLCFKQDNVTITLAPGYVLSRNKEKINVTISDDFFKEGTTKVSVIQTNNIVNINIIFSDFMVVMI